ncbi:MAG: bifunctional diguanylate cyclase/phosphodiesterase, partial [Rhodospirillales bacterium]|nr:bifunctional diguanylate cyclase/phosphodiesterase [Rhodospirillales bacterium]
INDIKNPFIVDGHELYVTASIGIAIFPEDGLAVEELIKNADEAMYRAKELGRNNFQLYSQVMNAQSVERINSEDKLRDAVEKEEFRLNYQVKVDASTGRMSGVEALIRWHSADMGVVQPRQFIPLAEDSGLITPIGEWVIQTACKQNKEWQKKGLPTIPVSVNISNHQIRNGNLSDFISETLKETGLDPEYLELEFTEASVMNGGGSASETISELSKIGVKISIDDFGTGFTNLNKLKRIKVDSLKIDQSFVHDMIADSDDMAIVATIIAMGKSMGMTVVAEGVETDDQVKFLKGEGCDEIQGYLISRPLSPENLISLFDRDLLPEAAS